MIGYAPGINPGGRLYPVESRGIFIGIPCEAPSAFISGFYFQNINTRFMMFSRLTSRLTAPSLDYPSIPPGRCTFRAEIPYSILFYRYFCIYSGFLALRGGLPRSRALPCPLAPVCEIVAGVSGSFCDSRWYSRCSRHSRYSRWDSRRLSRSPRQGEASRTSRQWKQGRFRSRFLAWP